MRSMDDVRMATASDAPELGRVHVAAWRETYAGIVPDAMLAKLSVESRAAMWDRVLSDPTEHGSIAVHVVEIGSEIVGFGSCGSQRTAGLRKKGYDGEIDVIYVLRSSQKRGIGSVLMQSMALSLSRCGFGALSLWVFRDNAVARRFYERCGGRLVGEKEEFREDAILIEVAYGWSDLTQLHHLSAAR